MKVCYCEVLVGHLRVVPDRYFAKAAGCTDVTLASSLHNEKATMNWRGQGESDCLIKTKQSDGRNLVLTLCDFCPVL